jgi:hypothetical protein
MEGGERELPQLVLLIVEEAPKEPIDSVVKLRSVLKKEKRNDRASR